MLNNKTVRKIASTQSVSKILIVKFCSFLEVVQVAADDCPTAAGITALLSGVVVFSADVVTVMRFDGAITE